MPHASRPRPAIPLVAIALLALPAPRRALAEPTAPPDAALAIVDPAVTARLASAPAADVVIALRGLGLPPGEARRADVADAQDSLLAAFTDGALRPYRRFRQTYALAASIDRAALDRLRRDPRVASVLPDRAFAPTLTEAQAVIRAPAARQMLGVTGKGLRVAVIDTGVDGAHPDLAGSVVAQKCFTDRSCPPGNASTGDLAPDTNGHGTHVAGIIASRGKVAPLGVAPEAEIVAVRVFPTNMGGRGSDTYAALDWILDNQAGLKVNVINMSLGSLDLFPGTCDASDPVLAEVMVLLHAAGIVIASATGNGGSKTGVVMPGCMSTAIAVGATYDANLGRQPAMAAYRDPENKVDLCFDAATSTSTVACFTNGGPRLELLAPGWIITSSAIGGGKRDAGGTSQATPMVAGAAALLLQSAPWANPELIRFVMESTGVPTLDTRTNRMIPRLDLLAAIQALAATCTGKPDGAPCDDKSLCTQLDACAAGKCLGKPVVCTKIDACRDIGVCLPLKGTCTAPILPDRSPCDDGDPCTKPDTCLKARCEAGPVAVLCPPQNACQAQGTCDPRTGTCVDAPRPDDTPCDDGNKCTRKDICKAGTCTGADPVPCPAADTCRAPACDPATGQCKDNLKPDTSPCDDGNGCTGDDQCTAGVCAGKPVTCPALEGAACRAPSCNPVSGQCVSMPIADGTACGNKGTCTAGACTGECACHLGAAPRPIGLPIAFMLIAIPGLLAARSRRRRSRRMALRTPL